MFYYADGLELVLEVCY